MSYTIYNIYIKVIGIFYYTSQGICFLIADLKFSLKAMFLVSMLKLFQMSIALVMNALAKNVFFLYSGFFNNNLSSLHLNENLVLW